MKALGRVLRRAATQSVFYARHLSGCDLELRAVEDLARLPFTVPADLGNWREFLCVSQGDVQRMVTLQTSGTMGAPKRLAFTGRDLARTRDFFRVGMAQLVEPGQRLAVLLPGAARPDGVADLLRQALGAAGVEVLCPPPSLADDPGNSPVGDETQVLAHWLMEQRPHCLVAAPAQLACLLDVFPQGAWPCLSGVLASADWLDRRLAQKLHAVWGCVVLDHYGLTETGYGCAVECPAHDGYHLRALDVLVEIVDPLGGAPRAAGLPGEVVITTLQREAMPLIRYRTGDMASLLPGPCACGSPLPRLGPPLGRLALRGGRLQLTHPAKGGRARAVMTEDASL